ILNFRRLYVYSPGLRWLRRPGICACTYITFRASEDGPWDNDTVSYSYTGQLRTGLSLLQPSGFPLAQSFAYDAASRLQTVTAPEGAYTYQYQGVGGLIKKLSLPNSAYITNSFDSVARLVSTTLKNSGITTSNSTRYLFIQAAHGPNRSETTAST